MDIFGIGIRLKNALHQQKEAARGTGRTTLLADMVQKGDVVVFSNAKLAREFDEVLKRRRNLTARSAEVMVISVRPCDGLQEVRNMIAGVTVSRLFFDHVWLEESYTDVLENHIRFLDGFSQAMSRNSL